MDLEAVEVHIVGFGGQVAYAFETKRLPMRVKDKENSRTIETNFLVVNILISYNVISDTQSSMQSK